MIGERLLNLRKDADMTQDDLAAVLNISKHSISSYERDKNEPPDDIKIAIAKYFGVSVDYLLGVTNSPQPYNEYKNFIHLPNDFPQEMMKALKSYADYLIYKFKKQKQNK